MVDSILSLFFQNVIGIQIKFGTLEIYTTSFGRHEGAELFIVDGKRQIQLTMMFIHEYLVAYWERISMNINKTKHSINILH